MNLGKIFQLYNLMSHQHFMMSYNGATSHQSVKSLLSVAEKKLGTEEADAAVRKKVFSVMMECLQSVCKGETGEADCVFMLSKDDERYTLYTCFYCTEDYKNRLVLFLDQLDSWGKDRLKEEHRLLLSDIFTHPEHSSLFSLIDITLKSKNKIDYDVVPDNDRHFVSLKTTINHRLAE